LKRGEALIDSVWVAEDATERMRGLLARPPLAEGEGMLITPCRMVHTFGMRYALDLVFLDRAGTVRKLVRHIRPARMAGSLASYATLELRHGEIDRLGLSVGDRLQWG
jgi:uncharacterized membrane protein (UPF0127 family)